MYYYRKKSHPLKKIIIIVILIIIVVLIYWFYKNYFSRVDFGKTDNTNQIAEQPAEPKVFLSNISFIQGQVEADINNEGYKTAAKDLILHQGDKVKTGKDSLAVINLENGSLVRLGQNTEIVLENLKEGELALAQNNGRSYYNLASESFAVESLDVKIKSTGTKFELIADAELKTVAVLSFADSVLVELNDDKGLLFARRVDPGQKVLFDLTKEELASKVTAEDFTPDKLAKDEWYKWNFDLDDKIGQPIESDEVSQPEDNEPDFMTTDESLSLSAKENNAQVNLSWSAYNKDDFKNYQIIKSETNSDLKYPENTAVKSSEDKGLNSYTDAAVKAGKKYYYRICVVKQNDKVVCGNVALIQLEKEEADTTPPPAPGLSASISVSGVSLSWTKNTDQDFKHYLILKSLSKLNPAYPDDKISTTGIASYLDNTVNITSVGKYYYRVCSFDQSDNFSCSNSVMIEDGLVK